MGRSLPAVAVAVAIVLSTAPAVALAASPSPMSWQSATVQTLPGAESAAIHGITCASSTTCAAVGNTTTAAGFQQGAALVTDTAGSSWTPALLTGTATSSFEGINYFGADCAALTCVAVGTTGYSENAVATSTDGGASWTALGTVPQPSPVQDNLAAVSCATYADCVAVGSDLGTTGSIGHFQILVSTSGGATWAPIKGLPQPSADNLLTGVSCVGSACVAVGYTQSLSGQVNNAVLVSTNGGQAWSLSANVPQPSGSSQWLSGVSCVSNTQCVAVGYETDSAGYNLNQVLVSNDGGQSWTLASVPHPGIATNGDTLNAVTCNAAECVAVGQYTSAAWVPDNQILVSTNGGYAWTLETAPNPGGPFASQQLTAVACASSTACMATGTVSGMNGGQVEALYGVG